MWQSPDAHVEAERFGECTACGETYPVELTGDDKLRAVGPPEGTCACGNDTFVRIPKR